jgi:membrane-bound ClpP family serine protease
MARAKFPVLGVLLLILGMVWLFNELGYPKINLPWIPVIVIVIAVAMIFNRFRR